MNDSSAGSPNNPLDFEDNGEENNDWVVIFADLCLLLLVFFVLLFSMSTLDDVRFKESFFSVRMALGDVMGGSLGADRIPTEDLGVFIDQAKLHRQVVENQHKIFSDFRYFQNTKGMEGVVGAVFDEGTITLRVPGDVLFASGQVSLTPAGKTLIAELKDFFVRYHDQVINIRGFTDDVLPSRGGRFEDNWEISALRAVNVLRYLIELGVEPARLTSTGLADMYPLFPNTSQDNRAKNRRVEFVLEKRIGS
ncbi:chemotaxis protein MotB [Desulfonatronum thiosulfatophilum]|uniref:Chemotaxis protein MotB n=1 Tax=Desulfonatronum thiosulfatophilum TaxID=617002 RepID=A0A1G6D249_9BACT|nr:OmpA family protein [Desulfonatronum thiosulfatophilum]SDB39188.1 chemotaxis protein MotB [Desulfonatronum thiosulfatophilum]